MEKMWKGSVERKCVEELFLVAASQNVICLLDNAVFPCTQLSLKLKYFSIWRGISIPDFFRVNVADEDIKDQERWRGVATIGIWFFPDLSDCASLVFGRVPFAMRLSVFAWPSKYFALGH